MRDLKRFSKLACHGLIPGWNPLDAVRKFAPVCGLMKLLAGLARSVTSLFGRRDDALNRSKLVGLYLTQTNAKDGAASEFNQRRQRRNGKYSHNRERA